MGWKAVKEHYQIKHHVQITSAGLCIGSDYIHNIIVVSPAGEILKRYDFGHSDDLARHQRDIESDPDRFRELMCKEDVFSRSITVYTFDDGLIIEKRCEDLDWPNVTHDGCIMHNNAYSTDKEKVVQWAKRDIARYSPMLAEQIDRKQKELDENKAYLAKLQERGAALDDQYPHILPKL